MAQDDCGGPQNVGGGGSAGTPHAAWSVWRSVVSNKTSAGGGVGMCVWCSAAHWLALYPAVGRAWVVTWRFWK